MIVFPQNQSRIIVKIPIIIVAVSCLTLLNACSNQEISDESTLGSNNAAQTNPDKIERNSMDDVANVNEKTTDSSNDASSATK